MAILIKLKGIYTKKITLLFLCIIGATLNAIAQGVSGKIVDINRQAIDGASIVLQTKDSTFIGATVSKSDGTFLIPTDVRPFILIVQHITYKTQEHSYDKSDIGTIVLTTNNIELEEFVVKGGKQYVKTDGGKLVYNTQILLENKIANNAWELINKLPGVSSKGAVISLVGTQTVAVIIDGRLSTMSTDQLQAMLNNTPANRVEKVEVMYNAPPQYHINGAVINIQMKHSNTRSVEGEVSTNYNNQYYSGGGINNSLRVTTPKASFDVMYGANKTKEMDYIELDSKHTLNANTHDIRQSEKLSKKHWDHNLRTSLDYKFDEKNSLNIAYTGMYAPKAKNRSHSDGNFQSSINKKDIDSNMHNISLYTKLGSGFSAGMDYTHYTSDNSQNLNIDYKNGNTGKVASFGKQKIDRYAVYIDQNHSIKNSWGIGYGASYIYSHDRDLQTYSNVEGITNTQNINSKLEEHNADLYISTSKQFNIGLSLDVSLKGEYYKIADYKKWAVYPQFSLTYANNPKHIYQLGLSTNKIYPSYWAMQSSVNYIDGYSEVHGSPGIRPSKNYNLNANYILNQKYVFGGFYSHSKDYFAQSPYQSTERLALIYKMMNWNYTQTAGVNIILPFSAGSWLDSRVTLVGLYLHQKCDKFFDLSFNREKFGFIGNLDNSFIVNKHLLFELNARFQSPMIQGTFDISRTSSVDLGMKWKFAKNKMDLSVFLYDMFNTSQPKLTVDYKGQNLMMDTSFYSRSINVKLIYRFGGYKTKKIKEVDTSRFGH